MHIQLQQATPVCSLDDFNLCNQDKSPLHISCALAPARICIARQTIEAHQIVGTVQLGSEHIQLIQQPMFLGIGVIPNVRLTTIMCTCGEHHCQVTAVRPIGEQEILCSELEEREETLLVQFDGSCNADRGVGGAGAALFEVQSHGIALINWRALALPACPDNIYAEAMSANVGVDLLCQEIVKRAHSVRQAYLQGDILPLVKHLAFAGRFRRIDLQPIVQQIRYKQSRLFDFGTWMYRPREANIIADHLAGIASQAASALPAEQQQPVEIQVPAPYDTAIRTGAIILEEKDKGPTILNLQETSSVNPSWVKQFLLQPEYQKYTRDLDAYIAGTSNLTQPRLVEYSATAIDNLGRLYIWERSLCSTITA